MARKNPNVKKPNTVEEYTPEQIQELKRCAEDPVYFIENYVKIQHPTKGAVAFDLHPYQRKVIKAYLDERFVVVLSARQTGKTTISAAYLLWYSIFHFDKTILVASNKNNNAMEMILRIQYAYEYLPQWLKPGIKEDGWNKHSTRFDNGSRIESTATSEDAGRGMSISLLYLDEFAFVNANIQNEFWTAMSPTLSTGGSCIMTSTPNGDSDIFAQIWRGAKLGVNGFLPIHIAWNEPPGRDEKFKQEEIGRIGEQRWMQEYECQFLSNDALLFNSLTLTNMTPQVEKRQPIFQEHGVFFWKRPIPGNTYLVGVDPATGSGNDFTVIEVFEFPSMEQVAEFRSNTMSSSVVYPILKKLLLYLEQEETIVFFSVENNGVGEGIIALYETDDSPPRFTEMASEEGKNRQGMNTSGKKKIRACLSMKEMVDKELITVCSNTLLQEMKDFVHRKQSYEAKNGSTDDCIAATLIVIRLLEEIATYDQDAYETLYDVGDLEGGFEGEEYDYDDDDDAFTFIM